MLGILMRDQRRRRRRETDRKKDTETERERQRDHPGVHKLIVVEIYGSV